MNRLQIFFSSSHWHVCPTRPYALFPVFSFKGRGINAWISQQPIRLAPLPGSLDHREYALVDPLAGKTSAPSRVYSFPSSLERSGGNSFVGRHHCRFATGGKAKTGESAKEKKLRRLLKKLNPIKDKSQQHEEADDHEDVGEGSPTTQHRKGGWGKAHDSSRAAIEAECTQIVMRAEQHMHQHLQQMEAKLKELQVVRPQLENFEKIHVHVGGSARPLADVGQVMIRGSSVVRVTLFNEQHLSKVVSALRKTDENWAIVEEGPNIVRVQLPRMNEELRSSFITKAKTATEECKVQIRRVRQEARGKLHGLWEKVRGFEESGRRENEQKLQKMTDEAVKRASGLLSAKLQQLTNPST